jgi:autotransporter-associated beta strand protein
MRTAPRIAAILLAVNLPASAATSTWIGPGQDFATPTNWSAGVPTDIAEFSGTAPVSPVVAAPANPGSPVSAGSYQLNTIQFDSGAGPYSITLEGTQRHSVTLTVAGSGIRNLSSNTQQLITNGGLLAFTNQASLDAVTLINQASSIDMNRGQITFDGTSNAGQATILNRSATTTSFNAASSAGAARITNSAGTTLFNDQASAGRSTLTNLDSAFGNSFRFNGAASGDEAVIINNGTASVLDISGLTTSGTTAGSISGNGQFLLGSKALTVGSNGQSTTVDGVISGSGGSLTKTGAGTLTLSAANSYTGMTTVNAGILRLLGSLAGAASVEAGGLLTGSGSLGSLTNRGQVTPGSGSSGAMHVASYSGPGFLNIAFDGAAHSALQVSGTADVSAGTLNLSGSRFTAGEYSVLNAGAVNGTFASVRSPSSAFLSFQERYTPNDVFVDIVENGASFQSVAQTSNQTSVATALDTVKQTAPETVTQAINTITTLSADEARAAYNQLGGDALTVFQGVSLQAGNLLTRQMNERAHPSAGLSIASDQTPVQLAYIGDVRQLGALRQPLKSNGIWARGIGLFDHTEVNATVGSPEARSTTGGMQGGYDHSLGEDFLLGVAAGYAETTLDVMDRQSTGKTIARQAGVYGSFTPGSWFFNASLGLTRADNDMARQVGVAPSETAAHARFNSCVFSGFGEAGYAIKPGERLSLEPSLTIDANHIDQDGFTETGAPGFNLSVENQKFNSLVSGLGLRLARLFGADSHPSVLGVHGAWLHEHGDINNKVAARLAEAPAASFTVRGAPQKRDAAAFGLDARAALAQALDFFASYTATLSTGKTDHGMLGGLSLRW